MDRTQQGSASVKDHQRESKIMKKQSQKLQEQLLNYSIPQSENQPRVDKQINPKRSLPKSKPLSLGNETDKEHQEHRTFDPFRIPPCLIQCQNHRNSTQFGKNVDAFSLNTAQKQENADIEECPCCAELPKQTLPVCSTKNGQIYEINESLGYYFSYLKAMCVMLFLMAVSVGVYSFWEIIGNCDTEQTQQNCAFIYGIPVSKFHVFFTDILIFMNIGILVLIYIVIGYLYWKNADVHHKIVTNVTKPSDFAVLLSNVDHEKITGAMIKEEFKDFTVTDIIYTHKVGKYVEKLSKKSTLEAKKHLYYQKGLTNKMLKVEAKIKQIDDEVIHIKNRLNLGQEVDLRTDKIIVQFSSTKGKALFDEKYKSTIVHTIYYSFCGGSLITINQVPLYIEPIGEPIQMVWENLELKSKDRYIRVFVGNIITLLILGISYILVAMMTRIERGFEGTGDILFSIIFALIVEAINFILDMSIEKITHWEQRYTLTGKTNIILIKNVISFFLNTTLIPFSLFLFDWNNPDENDLIRNIFTLFIVSNFVSPVISLYLQPKYIQKMSQRRSIAKLQKDCLLTQIKANQAFEKVGFELPLRYSLAIQRLTNCMFYGAVFPVGIGITFIGMILTYWSSKWWLINYCSIPRYSFRLGKLVNHLTCLFPCIYAFGYAANLYMVPQSVEFDRLYSIEIAVVTVPITIVFWTFGNIIAEWRVKSQHSQKIQEQRRLEQNGALCDVCQFQPSKDSNQIVRGYRQLNPTSFFHRNLYEHIHEIEFENMWNNLLSYAIENEVTKLKRHSAVTSRVSILRDIDSQGRHVAHSQRQSFETEKSARSYKTFKGDKHQ